MLLFFARFAPKSYFCLNNENARMNILHFSFRRNKADFQHKFFHNCEVAPLLLELHSHIMNLDADETLA